MSRQVMYIAFAVLVTLCGLPVAAVADAPSTLPTTSPAGRLQGKVDFSRFKLVGDPTSAAGATWTYESTDEGIEFKLNGTLFKPAGAGPFPAALISHGQGQTANVFGAKVSAEMVKWGLVCMAVNYTFAGGAFGEGTPGPANKRICNPTDNLKRAGKCLDLLAQLPDVDSRRIAIHGHSMGAFMTVCIAGAFPGRIKAASHTAGGDLSYNHEYALKIKTPYSIHHGDADKAVALACDQRLDAILNQNQVDHEIYVYPGITHPKTSMNPTVMERIRAWYVKQGVLRIN